MSPMLLLDGDAGRHMNDDDLVSMLDGASSASATWSAHLISCVECHARVKSLSRAATALRIAYNETDIPDHLDELPQRLRVRERAAVSSQSFWASGRFARRAAAILLIAVVGTAAAATVRQLVRNGDSSVTNTVPSPVSSAPASARLDTASIAFGVSSGVITLDFASTPGVLRARLGDSDTLRLLVTSSDSVHASSTAPALIALPDGIRIVNTASSGASYDVILPAAAQELRVRLGGRDVSVLHRPRMSADRNVTVPVESGVAH